MIMTDNRKLWINAYYFYTAKKAVDTIWFLSKHSQMFQSVGIDPLEYALSRFYLECVDLLEMFFSYGGVSKNKANEKKKALREVDPIVNAIYVERDKRYAHRDSEYNLVPFTCLEELKNRLIKQITHVRDICSKVLPEKFTLDFVPTDRTLVRIAYPNLAIIEKKYKKQLDDETPGMYNLTGSSSPYLDYGFSGEDLQNITIDDRLGLDIISLISVTPEEGLQADQDFTILTNIKFDENKWTPMPANFEYNKWEEPISEKYRLISKCSVSFSWGSRGY